ncbi:hypothetical protein [Avibacterium avium]
MKIVMWARISQKLGQYSIFRLALKGKQQMKAKLQILARGC